MIEGTRYGQPHGGAQDAAGKTGQALAGLTQDLHARVGEQRVSATGAFQAVLNQLGKTFALLHRFELDPRLDAPGQSGVRWALQGEGQRRMADQPDAEQTARIEGEVEEGREIAKELGRQILRLGQAAQGRRLADAGFAGQETDAGRFEQPVETFAKQCQRSVIPEIKRFLAQRRMTQTKVVQVRIILPPDGDSADRPTR